MFLRKLTALFLLAMSTMLSAQNQDSSFTAGLFFVQYDYKELNISPLKSTEFGMIPGVHVAFSSPFKATNIKFELGGSFAKGDLKYDGTFQNGTPVTDHNDHTFYEVEGGLVAPIGKNDVSQTDLKVGIKYALWDRNIKGGVLETYSWWTIPIGLRYSRNLDPSWTLTTDATVLWMFSGNMRYQDASNDLDIELGAKPGYGLSMTLAYKTSQAQQISIMPWYHYYEFGYGESEDRTLAEPDSRTHRYGVMLKVTTLF